MVIHSPDMFDQQAPLIDQFGYFDSLWEFKEYEKMLL